MIEEPGLDVEALTVGENLPLELVLNIATGEMLRPGIQFDSPIRHPIQSPVPMGFVHRLAGVLGPAGLDSCGIAGEEALHLK